MHYYVVSHHANKSLSCHESIDGARMDIVNELNVGLQAYIQRGNIYDIRQAAEAMNEAASLDAFDSYMSSYSEDSNVVLRGRSWHIETCSNVTCRDGMLDW